MGVLTKVLSRLGYVQREKASRAIGAALRAYGPGRAQYMTADITSFIEDGYGANPYVYACVSLIARAAAGVPWYCYQEKREGERERVDSQDVPGIGRLHEMMTVAPNPEQGISEFIEAWVSYKLIGGEAFIELVGPENGLNAGQVQELHALRPDRMTVEVGRSAQEPLAGYTYQDGAETEFTPEQILHSKFFNPDSYWRGMSPMQAAVRAITRQNAYEDWNVALAQNMGKTGGIMVFEEYPTEEQREQIDRRWEETHAGPHGAGKLMKTGGLKDFIESGMSPVDADWLEGHKSAAVMACIVYGVAPELVGIADQKTYSNVKEARAALYTETVIPLLVNIRDELNRVVAPSYGEDVRLDVDVEAIEALKRDQAEAVSSLKDAWWLTPNERRAEMSYERLEDAAADSLWVPAGLVPMTPGDTGDDTGDDVERAARQLEDAGVREYGFSLNQG